MKTQMNDTSLQSFEKILPRIGERQHQVLEHLSWVGNATNAMIAASIKLPINCVTGRTNELVKMRCVIAVGKEECPVTHGIATFWQITDRGNEVIAFRKNKVEDIFK